MAITYDTIAIGGVSRDVLTIAGTGATRTFILKDVLAPVDVAVFDLIDASAGADLEAKFAAYVMPNGMFAIDVYAPSIKTFAAYDASVVAFNAANDSTAETIALYTTIDTRDARIVLLEQTLTDNSIAIP
jgi:hypothetical protein